jgi:hypothetical protein
MLAVSNNWAAGPLAACVGSAPGIFTGGCFLRRIRHRHWAGWASRGVVRSTQKGFNLFRPPLKNDGPRCRVEPSVAATLKATASDEARRQRNKRKRRSQTNQDRKRNHQDERGLTNPILFSPRSTRALVGGASMTGRPCSGCFYAPWLRISFVVFVR